MWAGRDACRYKGRCVSGRGAVRVSRGAIHATCSGWSSLRTIEHSRISSFNLQFPTSSRSSGALFHATSCLGGTMADMSLFLSLSLSPSVSGVCLSSLACPLLPLSIFETFHAGTASDVQKLRKSFKSARTKACPVKGLAQKLCKKIVV